MQTLDQVVRDAISRDPSMAYELALAKAELKLAEQIAAARRKQGLSQQALAEKTGIAQSAIARYEKAGRSPTIETLWRFADALNAHVVVGPRFSVAVIPGLSSHAPQVTAQPTPISQTIPTASAEGCPAPAAAAIQHARVSTSMSNATASLAQASDDTGASSADAGSKTRRRPQRRHNG